MKIGVITWYGGPNYGTNLQAISLQRVLKRMGYEVTLINYVQPKVPSKVRLSLWQRIAHQPQKYADRYSQKKYRTEIESKCIQISKTLQSECSFTPLIEDEETYISVCNQFDVLICGSDQIWNPCWYHPYYYADFPGITAKKISYAPSLGVSKIDSDITEKIKKSLSTFSKVSVREEIGAKVLMDLMYTKPEVVLDPTFLVSQTEWRQFISQEHEESEYVLSLFLSDNCKHWKAARKLAKKEGIKHIVVPYSGFSYLQNADVRTSVGIEALLSLLFNAKYIVTDSYHITVFSLIFNKDFYTFMRFKDGGSISQNSRIVNLLKMVDLECRMVPNGSSRIILKPPIQYKHVNSILDSEIKKSLDFLRKAMEQ